MNFNREGKDITIQEHSLHIVEPLEADITKAGSLAKDHSLMTGVPYQNAELKNLWITAFMVESWKMPDGKMATKDEIQKAVTQEATGTFVDQLVNECILFRQELADKARNLSKPTTPTIVPTSS